MSTIADVASHAGVSIKTVSKVLNGDASVRPRLKVRILDSMAALDYRPALAARQLASGKSYIVALLVPSAQSSYFARLISGMSEACARRGYHSMIETIAMDGWTPIEAALRLSCNPDAIVVAPPLSNDPLLLAKLEQLGIPFSRIAANGKGPGIAIPAHSFEAGREVTRHLLAQGHRRIAMLAPPSEDFPADDRRLGYIAALAEADVPLDPRLVVRTDLGFAAGVAALQALMALADRPTAIFASTDTAALGAMAKAQQLGFRVPQDLAIAGFDNSSESRHVYPALTTVHQPVEEIVRAAVDAALGDLDAVPDFVFQLIVRGSTGGAELICADG